MMKVPGVVGSPRRGGNTHVLVTSLLEGAFSCGAETETLLLGEMTVRECDGYHACWRGKGCCKKDDMATLYQRIGG